MIDFAFEAILSQFEGRKPKNSFGTFNPTLAVETALYVDLHVEGRPRGCMGGFYCDRSLLSLVAALSRLAAFGDDRYPALEMGELEKLDLRIWWGVEFERNTLPNTPRRNRAIRVTALASPMVGVYLPYAPFEEAWSDQETILESRSKAGIKPLDSIEITYFQAQCLSLNPNPWQGTLSQFLQDLTPPAKAEVQSHEC